MATTTIDAGFLLPLVSEATGGLLRRGMTPRLDVEALRRLDVRRPPRRLRGCRIRPITLGRARHERVLVAELSPPRLLGPSGRRLVYVHGGVHVSGPYWPQWLLASTLCRGLGALTLMPLYRRAPEHPFPAAYQDINTVLEVLANQAAGPVLLAGDSSGGGLAAAIGVHRNDVARLALVSPWLDLALAADDIDDSRDVILAAAGMRQAARLYADGHVLSDPRLSPMHATLTHLPPTMVQAGTEEVLVPDARRFAERARAAGADVELVEGRGLPHGWATMPLAREATAARRLLIDHLSS